ncbi:hypothetical protein PBRA_001019 [Plasmodiophora brassicae]|nr:hypothetical protein PBRA_001019 [Plasmodiophora brassicae]
MAADLMRKAQESRRAAETVVAASTAISNGQRHRSVDAALAKLKTIKKTHKDSVAENDIRLVVMLNDSGEEHHALLQHVFPANKPLLVGEASDLTSLTYMEEPNVLRSLQERYGHRQCYTAIASILVAVNPYKRLDIYGADYMMKYRTEANGGAGHKGKLPPHIFAWAETAYADLCRPFSTRRQAAPVNQSIIVCGESGSGKTESSKYLMRYLANRSHSAVGAGDDEIEKHERLVERQVLEANHILEAFGNANTLLNHNSSRFGKFTRLYFATENVGAGHGEVVGASTTTYLLEKSRLVRQNKGERNFHVFYQLCAGLNAREKAELHLEGVDATEFHYINQGGCMTVDGIDDREWFSGLLKSMGVLGITEADRAQVFSVIAAILHLGNIDYVEDPKTAGASIIKPACETSLQFAADLLGLSSPELKAAFRKRLTTVRIKTPTEWIEKNLSVTDARFNRDSVAKSIYSGLFGWVVGQINRALTATTSLPWIGILDVFGFESFQTNSFEQFCINFANEMLQQHFNQEILLSEQKEYAKEAILWQPMNVPDNQSTIDLVSDSRTGILSLLDSSCRMRGTTVDAFVDSLIKAHAKHERFDQVVRRGVNKDVRAGFVIHHYAGHVVYNAAEFLVKNNDSDDPDSVALFSQSSSAVLRALFQANGDDEPAAKAGGPRKAQTSFSSVSATFKKQLASLMETLQSTSAYFVRCIKPNTKCESWAFDLDYVRPQLRCGGLVEAVRMLKVGFPTRVTFDQVYAQYSPLLDPAPRTPLNKRDFSQAVLFLFGLRRNEYQLGLTKVFFRAGKRAFLETVMNRDEKLTAKDMAALMGFINRKRWQRLIGTVKSLVIQWRAIKLERCLEQWRQAARILCIYHRSLVRRLRRARRTIAIRRLQAAVKTYSLTCAAMGELRKAKLEQERLARLEQERQEQSRRQKQAEEAAAAAAAAAAQEDEQRRAEAERAEIAAAVARATAAAGGAGAAAAGGRGPKSSTSSRVASVAHSRVASTLAGQGTAAPAGAAGDSKRVQALEAENAQLQEKLRTALAEIDRLKDVVDQLDDINNRLVEDLMNELVLRTQVQEESAGGGPLPAMAQGDMYGAAAAEANVDQFKASGGFVPPAHAGPRRQLISHASARRNESECAIQ